MYGRHWIAEPAIKTLLFQARWDPEIRHEIARLDGFFADMAAPDFAAVGSPEPRVAASVFTAMCAEAALGEMIRGGADEGVRAALLRFVLGPGGITEWRTCL